MTLTAPSLDPNALLFAALQRAIHQVDGAILGKPREVRLAFACLLAGGHLLLDDLPGLGKTTLAHAIAATLGLSFQRVQFTSDLMPTDIVGVSMPDGPSGTFRFHKGPVFTHLLLADEINRASPRTQSALLEAMAEQQVSVDGMTHALPDPFFVIATQNPVDLSGTFPLPDSQLDRFLIRLHLGYPDPASELALLRAHQRRSRAADLQPVLSVEGLKALREATFNVHTSEDLLTYVQRLLRESRQHKGVRVGLSPRAGLALLSAAQAHAFVDARDSVRPDDVKAVFEAVAAHRLVPTNEAEASERVRLAHSILAAVAVR